MFSGQRAQVDAGDAGAGDGAGLLSSVYRYLKSTAGDYIRFERMILNSGTLDGARILSAKSVALMSKNQIGEIGVRALKTASPSTSMDFSFIDDGRDKWGLGFLITMRHVEGSERPGA